MGVAAKSTAGALAAPRLADAGARLPNENLRDWANALARQMKFRWVPFRGYYRLRAHKYMRRIDPEMGLLKFLVDATVPSIDVGANLGIFTYFLSRYAPIVYAFEPNPIPFAVLDRLKDRNVVLRQMALTDRSGDVELVVPKGRKGWTNNGAGLDARRDGNHAVLKVPGSRLDDLGLPRVGFIKIDVEGHELAVLRGAAETLARHRPNLFIENEYAHAGEASGQVFALLRDLDYDGFFLADGVLKNLSQFDFEKYQLKPRRDPRSRHRYVKNFIFLPR